MSLRGAALALALTLAAPLPGVADQAAPDTTPPTDTSALLDFAASLDARFLPGVDQRIAGLRAMELRLGRATLPEADCHRALGARRYAELHAELARAHASLGETEPAIRAFRRALDCAPRDPEYHAELGDELLDGGRLAEAADVSARGLAIAPSSYALNSLQLRLDFVADRWALVPARAAYLLSTSGDEETLFYWNFFRRVAEQRLGRTPTAVAEARIPENWPGPLWRHLLGELDEQALVAAIREEAEGEVRRREMACEALYYTALDLLGRDQHRRARARLAAAVNLKVVYFLEHSLAKMELAKLRSAPLAAP